MKLLLDTQCWLWMLARPERLRRRSRRLLESLENEIFLSSASSWEMAIKYSLGKLPFPQPPAEIVPALLARTGCSSLAIQHSHALAVAGLPRHHDDPFDRMLIAQAITENLPIMTSDRQFAAYDVEVLEA